MSPHLSRRQLARATAATGAGALALPAVLAEPADARPRASGSGRPLFPPLQVVDGAPLALPEGFRATVVASSHADHPTLMNDGTPTPVRPDGTLVVATGTGYRLVQNHEISPGGPGAVPLTEGTAYDEGVVGGGCTIIDVTPTGHRIKEWVGLSGTIGNCAGGPTPWGSWLTCEESEARAGTGGLQQDHGYVFEVFARHRTHQLPKPIRAWGRAAHEAVVVAPGRRRVFLTEDAPSGLLYRWTAPDGVRLQPRIAEQLGDHDGRLQALRVHLPSGDVLTDLAYVTGAQVGRPFVTSWVDVPDRLAGDTPMRFQLADGEVTRGRKLEGAWGDDRGFWFVSSFANVVPADATPHDGQLWHYDYADRTLTLRAYFPYNPLLHREDIDPETDLGPSLDLAFDGPDGCHVSPYGPLILTEDGATANHVLAWTRGHGAQAIARNITVQELNGSGKPVYSELTGPCFSPDGKLLFVNIQIPGTTLAIHGPWATYLG